MVKGLLYKVKRKGGGVFVGLLMMHIKGPNASIFHSLHGDKIHGHVEGDCELYFPEQTEPGYI